MDEDTFYILANLAKSSFERMRPWRKLVTKDISNSSTGATTYATQFTLPATFLLTLPRRTLRLVSVADPSNWMEMTEVPYERWDEFKNQGNNFAIDHASNKYYVSSIVDSVYTHVFFFIASSAQITDSVGWVFPSEFHPAIAFEVAAMDELGMDYDDLNARAGNNNSIRAQLVMRGAVKWDETLARSALGA